MRVLVTKVSDPSMWYADEVGNEFYVFYSDSNEYVVRASDGCLNIILREDAKEIHDAY